MANFDGTNGPDPINGSPDADTIFGLLGDDVIIGGGGNDQIHAGPERQLFPNITDNDLVYGDDVGGASNDTIYAGYGNDRIFGDNPQSSTGGSDLIYGDSGKDEIYGGHGSDYLDGGEGDDVLFGDSGGGQFGEDVLVGGIGSDRMVGGAGNDLYDVDNANDVVEEEAFAGSGHDTVRSRISYTLSANVEDLALVETAVQGTGNSLDNRIYGNAADNVISGNAGNDFLFGGAGNDTISGATGSDTANFTGQYTAYNTSFTSTGAIQITGTDGTDLLTGIERIEFGGGGFYNVRVGDGQDNRLTANPDVWSFLFGGGGNDTLTGGNGNDNLAGSSGNDVLIGGNGSDILTGGVGADKFRFNVKSEGIDLIKDFNRGEGDKIEIVKSSFGASSLSQFSYNSTTGALSFGSTQLATLENKPAGFSIQTDIVLM